MQYTQNRGGPPRSGQASTIQWLERADDIIRQFDQLDPSSFAFRYPVDTEGRHTLPMPLLLDPALVRDIMAELDILLSGASIQISEYQSLKNEGL